MSHHSSKSAAVCSSSSPTKRGDTPGSSEEASPRSATASDEAPRRTKPVAHVKPIVADTPPPPKSNSPHSAQPHSNLGVKEHAKQPCNRPVLSIVKAKKCKFFRNGDRFFKGINVALSSERYRTLNSITEELTRVLLATRCVLLPSGVRVLYAMTDGHKIMSADELQDGESYACAGPGESYRRVDYSPRDSMTPPWCNSISRKRSSRSPVPAVPHSVEVSQMQASAALAYGNGVPPKLVQFVRSGTRPRKVVRVLLNSRNSPSFDAALSHITEYLKLDSGAVRKIFTVEGKQVTTVQELCTKNTYFFAYGSERHSRDDLVLDVEEYRSIQTLNKATGLRGVSMTSSAITKPSRKLCGSEEHLSVSGRHSPAGRSPLPRSPRTAALPKPKMPKKTKKTRPVKHSGVTAPPAGVPADDNTWPTEVARDYDIGRVIGDGNFAVVRECTNKKTNLDYALKIIEKEKCKGKEHMIISEVSILRRVKHPNIVHLYAEYDYSEQLYLVMELVKGGDLFDAIAAASKFSERDSATLTRHLCSALSYLHKRRIVHRDIKPENLLVDIDETGSRILKLGDFGLAQEVTEPLYMVCGTPTYVAPEILAETGYSFKVDIWAAGVILYILLCGFPPFVSISNDQEELFDQILSGMFEFPSPYWDHVTDPARELVASMLQVDQELRFSAEDVLDHPWLTDCYSDDDEASFQLYHKLGVHFEPPENSGGSGSNHQMIAAESAPCLQQALEVV